MKRLHSWDGGVPSAFSGVNTTPTQQIDDEPDYITQAIRGAILSTRTKPAAVVSGMIQTYKGWGMYVRERGVLIILDRAEKEGRFRTFFGSEDWNLQMSGAQRRFSPSLVASKESYLRTDHVHLLEPEIVSELRTYHRQT